MTTREFHFQDGTSSKFWRIEQSGCAYTVQFGRIGTAGQTQTKSFPDEQGAAAAYTKQIAEKLKKGYREITTEQPHAEAQPAAAAPAEAPAPADRPDALSRLAQIGRTVSQWHSKLKKGFNEITAEQPDVEVQPAAAPVAAPVPAISAVVTRPGAPVESLSAPAHTSPPKVETLDTTPRLNLDPSDWFWAHWRNPQPLTRPAPVPFDLTDALGRLARIGRTIYRWHWKWEAAIPDTPSAEEATFWLLALKYATKNTNATPPQIAQALAGHDSRQILSSAQALNLLSTLHYSFGSATITLAAALCSPQAIVKMLLAQHYDTQYSLPTLYSTNLQELLLGLRRFVVPYLSREERARLSAQLTPYLDPTTWPSSRYHHAHVSFYLAAMLGGHDAVLRKVVASWADDMFTRDGWSDYYQRPQEIVLGLNDPLLVQAEMRRLGLRLSHPPYVRAWLAHTEYAAPDVIRDSIAAVDDRDKAADLVQAFALAVAPTIAPCMLSLMHSSKAPQVARAWLEEHPSHTIVGLLPVAMGRGASAEAATDLLRRLARRGYEPLIDAALAQFPADTTASLRAQVLDSIELTPPPFDAQTTPGWFNEAQQLQPSLKSAKSPAWVGPSDLPPVVVGSHMLHSDQVAILLRALLRSKIDAPHPLVVALKQHADPASLDAFAWALFELWLTEGAPSKENWAFYALGLLGGDTSALKLAPLIRVWPGESQHQRAVNGLECLRAIGSDTALMQINSIAQKVKFKGLQQRAGECMERVAKDRGLNRAELEDRIVPDCDLDERGERIFDFGPRQFRFVLGPEMKPMVRDAQGKLKSSLPAPTGKDDPAKAEQATAEWKLLKKQVAQVAALQALRLEQAMVTGRRWSRADFETLLVRHPLMTHLARALVWGVYDATGTLTATFRVTEDQSYADRTDDTFDLPPDATVAIVHPLHLAPGERAAWGEILSDYEIVQPFAQLGRPIHRLEEYELSQMEITRFNNLTLAAATLVFGLDKLGWIRDAPADGGGFSGHSKPFYQANVTAVVQYHEGVAVGWIVDSDDQHIEYVAFVPGIQDSGWWPQHKDRLPLSEIDSLVISEVLNDMMTIAAKAK
jgi:predicted DNA-binding WGR domain protein